MIGVFASLVLAASVGQAGAASEIPETCGVIVSGADGALHYEEAPGYSVANAHPLKPPAGFEAFESIVCDRPELIFTDNDFRVVSELQTPLDIRTGDLVGVLEMIDGMFRFSALRGTFTDEQAVVIQAALDRGQNLVQAEPRP